MRSAFTGGSILTMDTAHANPEVVVVDGDRIVAVGARGLLETAAEADTEIVDLQGATLVPGFIDAHNHLSISALHPRWLSVAGITDVADLVGAIQEQAIREPDTAWVRCQGINLFELPATRADLDIAGLDRPVIVADYTLHQCVVSSTALEVLGIGRTTGDPPGGEYLRDASGEPTGVLVERGWSRAHAESLRDYCDPDQWATHIAARARVLHADGITAIHDAACAPEAEAVYAAMARSGGLPISVVGMPHPSALLMNDHQGRLDGPPTGEGDERFRVGAMKLFADGGVSIALDTTVGGAPVQFGTRFGDLAEHARIAAERGFRIAIHAMGNVAVDAMLEVCTDIARRQPGADHRFRVEHAAVTSPEQWKRLAQLGVVAVVQPGFVDHVGMAVSGMHFDHHHWLAFAGLLDAGVTLAGSSDDPCAPVPPLWGAAHGVDRRTHTGKEFELEQSVPFTEWLAAYTSGAAYAGGQEHERGSLTPGKRADLVVLDEIERAPRVRETWVGGTRVFDAGPTLT